MSRQKCNSIQHTRVDMANQKFSLRAYACDFLYLCPTTFKIIVPPLYCDCLPGLYNKYLPILRWYPKVFNFFKNGFFFTSYSFILARKGDQFFCSTVNGLSCAPYTVPPMPSINCACLTYDTIIIISDNTCVAVLPQYAVWAGGREPVLFWWVCFSHFLCCINTTDT